MDFLIKDIIQEIIPSDKVTILYPGAFKPPHKGHFEVVKKSSQVGDKVIVIVSPKDRDGVTLDQSLRVWNLYKKLLPDNVEIRVAQGSTPVSDVYDIIKNNPNENFLAAFGKEEGSRFDSITKSGKYPNADIIDIGTIENFSATELRKAVRDRDIATIEKMLPDGITAVEFLEAMNSRVHENLFLIQEDELMDEVVNPDGDIFDYTEKSKGLFIYNDSKDNVYFVRLTFQPTENPYFELKTGWFEDNDFSKPKYEPNLPPNSTSLDNIKRRNTVSKIYRDEILPLFKQASSLSKLLKIQPISQSRFIFSDRLIKNHTPEDFNIEDNDEYITISLKEISDPSSIDPEQLKMGIEVEKEHTDDPVIARKIAIDHLKEDPKYYTKLATLKLEQQEDPLQDHINSINQFMVDKGLEIMPFPQVQYVSDDEENASQILGKTAYYNPGQNIIVLYTLGRHPKDVLRSYAHELIHHAQNLQGRIKDIGTTDVNEDDKLFKLEEEAYVLGNMIFRSWENSQSNPKKTKESDYYQKYKQYALTELFEKDLPNIEKINNIEYLVGNGTDIEAKYIFKLEIPDRNIWSMNWSFTPNNKNKSPEAWKQVTATSFKVLDNFLKNNNPKSIHISGNTFSKTNLYKNYVDKLQTLLNNKYKIDNSDGDKIVLRSIEESYQSSIQKRMETLNESYEQALHYWENGDINSKSKIERWNSIKKVIERKVIREMYKLDKTKKYYIFCDMDGVLVDFDKGYKDLTGVSTKHADVQNSKDFWNKLESSLKEKGLTQEDYWKGLDWMPDGKTLWNYIKQYNPYILTAPSKDPGSRTGKKEWVERLDNMKNIYFRAAQSKSDFAGKNKVLIDDREDTIESWRAKGGIGILHTSAANTIEQLKQIGL